MERDGLKRLSLTLPASFSGTLNGLNKPGYGNGLDQMLAETGFAGARDIVFHAGAAHCDAWDSVTLGDEFHEGVARHFRKLKVAQEEIERLGGSECQAAFSIHDDSHQKTMTR